MIVGVIMLVRVEVCMKTSFILMVGVRVVATGGQSYCVRRCWILAKEDVIHFGVGVGVIAAARL